jgi:rhodanese-related sulfurtransferase
VSGRGAGPGAHRRRAGGGGLATAAAPEGTRTIDEMLADARRGLDRVGPARARAEIAAGALLVDIRPAAQRAAEGEVPGALIIERNVLEWRFDPASGARLPEARYDLRIIVMCSEGYTSSLAAAALRELGVRAATDLDGGFRAWAASGLPVQPAALAAF